MTSPACIPRGRSPAAGSARETQASAGSSARDVQRVALAVEPDLDLLLHVAGRSLRVRLWLIGDVPVSREQLRNGLALVVPGHGRSMSSRSCSIHASPSDSFAS